MLPIKRTRQVLALLTIAIVLTGSVQFATAKKIPQVGLRLTAELKDPLTGKSFGSSDFRQKGKPTLSVHVRDFTDKANATLGVFVKGIRVGSITTDGSGSGHLAIDSRKQPLPALHTGDQIILKDGDAPVLLGSFLKKQRE